MNEYTVIAIFIAWYVLSLIVSESIGKKKKLGVEWSFFLSFLLSPVLGYFITRYSADK